MTDLREKVARAICDGVDWDAASTIQREEYLDNADAALAVIGPASVQDAARVLLAETKIREDGDLGPWLCSLAKEKA